MIRKGAINAVYRVGIVGCGGIAQVHSAVLNLLDETQLIACADIRLDRAQDMAEKYQCHAYESLDAMLENEQLDAVHICVPHYLHVPMALQIAEKGIAVFMEKPPLITREQWPMLEKAAELATLGVCFQNRFNPNVQKAKQLIENGSYGKIKGARAVVTWRRDSSYYVDSGWRGKWATEGGGVLMNQTIHTLDLLIYLLGKADTVNARMSNHHLQGIIEVEDTVDAYLTLQGKPVLFYATTAYVQDSSVLMEIALENATLRLEDDALEIRTREGIQRITFDLPKFLGKSYWGTGHQICITEFYHCMQEKRPFLNRLDAIRDTAETVLQIYEQGKINLLRG